MEEIASRTHSDSGGVTPSQALADPPEGGFDAIPKKQREELALLCCRIGTDEAQKSTRKKKLIRRSAIRYSRAVKGATRDHIRVWAEKTQDGFAYILTHFIQLSLEGLPVAESTWISFSLCPRLSSIAMLIRA